VTYNIALLAISRIENWEGMVENFLPDEHYLPKNVESYRLLTLLMYGKHSLAQSLALAAREILSKGGLKSKNEGRNAPDNYEHISQMIQGDDRKRVGESFKTNKKEINHEVEAF